MGRRWGSASNADTIGLGFSAGPNVGVTISGVPGATDHASIRIKRAHVSVNGCLGPTTVRVIARFSVSTPTADDTLNVYSARTWL